MVKKTRHIPLSKIDVVKYKIFDLIEESQRVVTFLSHFVLLVRKIYKFRNHQFISSYIGYYASFVFIFMNYIFYLNQQSNDAFLNPLLTSNGIRLDSKVDLKKFKFVIDEFEQLQSFETFFKHFQNVCEFDELILLNQTVRTANRNAYKQLIVGQNATNLLGRLLIGNDDRQSNFTIEINTYQLSMDYFHDFPFVTQRFNLFNFEFGLVRSHFVDIQNCVVQSMLREYSLENVVLFKINDLNALISLKTSFFYYLPLIIAIGWLPNCLSIAGEKLKEQNSNVKRLYKICGLDSLTYHLAYTVYIFFSLFIQTILFVIILHIINLPYQYKIVAQANGNVTFYRKLINSYVFLNIMIFYNLAVALHVQLFSSLYKTKRHFYISFTIYTIFTTLLPFSILYTHLRVPFQTFTDQAERIINTKFIIIYSTFLLCPNAALTYALRQIEDMSHIQGVQQNSDTILNLRTFESLSFYHVTINDVLYIFITCSIIGSILILNHELGSKAITKLLFLDFFKLQLQRFYDLIIGPSERHVLLRMVNFNARLKQCNCSVNNETHSKCVNDLRDLNLQAKSNEIIVILSNKHKAKEYLFKCLLGETDIKSGELYLDKYRLNSFIKPLFINRFPTSSIGVCFEDDIFDNDLGLEENLEIYSKLKSSQFVANTSDIMLLIHLLKLKEIKRIPVNLMNRNIKRKLAVAIALLGSQRILVLNEPTKGTDLETSKLIFETLVKLKHDKLIVILTTNPKLNFHSYADQLYVLNNCELFRIGTLHQLMNATHSGIHLIFRKLNRKPVQTSQIDDMLSEFFGEKEFALVCSNERHLIWYSYNINLIELCNEFRTAINQLSGELNVHLTKIKISRMKLNLNSNHQRPEPVAYEQNPNIFFIGTSRVARRQTATNERSTEYLNSNLFNELLYCLKIKLFRLESVLINLLSLLFVLTVFVYFLNAYEFFDFVSLTDQGMVGRESSGQHSVNGSETDKLKALDFSSSAIMDNLMVYVIETKREEFSLPKPNIYFKTKDLVKYIGESLNKELNTKQFLCIQIEDSFKYVHKEKIDTILIEKHVGGIMKLDYKTRIDGLIVNLVHNSHFPYLLLQIINLFTNFLIEHSTEFNRTDRTARTRMPFKINLQFNEINALRYLHKNLSNRIINFFLLSCTIFFLSIFLNENAILYFNRRSTIIKRNKRVKSISPSVYWVSNLVSDQLIGLLSWISVLVIVSLINIAYASNFFQFSIGK